MGVPNGIGSWIGRRWDRLLEVQSLLMLSIFGNNHMSFKQRGTLGHLAGLSKMFVLEVRDRNCT
jgi:hypothetical protein